MKNILNILRALFQKKSESFTGVVLDKRSEEEKEKDYLHEETNLAMAAAPSYDNEKITVSPFPLEDQVYTSSCVPHGATLGLGATFKKDSGTFLRLSKAFVYRQRSTYPTEGMWHQQAYDILRTIGSCLFDTLPTPRTEKEINAVTITDAMREEAAKYKGLEYYRFAFPNEIDSLASAADQGFIVTIVFFSSVREWSREYPALLDTVDFNKAPVRHCVTVLPNSGFIENGKKHITIQDSSKFGAIQLRHLSEDFVRARVYDAMYWKKAKIEAPSDKPVHTFVIPLQVGSKGEEVLHLQKVLVYEKLLPEDCITGLFAGRTRAAVKALQEKYGAEILAPVGLTTGTGYVGNSTLKWLTKNYSK